jgi:predicted HTH domain antitoxin
VQGQKLGNLSGEYNMSNVQITIEIPEDAYLALSSSGYSKGRISKEAKRLLAARLFQNGFLSLGKAAELAELGMGVFIDFLNELQIPVIDYDDEELEAEFRAVNKSR